MIDDTHDPARSSWVESANGHAAFPIQNLPLGVFSPDGGAARGGIAIGDLLTRDGDYYGVEVNLAARLADIIRPDECVRGWLLHGGKVTQPTDTRRARGCLSARSLARVPTGGTRRMAENPALSPLPYAYPECAPATAVRDIARLLLCVGERSHELLRALASEPGHHRGLPATLACSLSTPRQRSSAKQAPR